MIISGHEAAQAIAGGWACAHLGEGRGGGGARGGAGAPNKEGEQMLVGLGLARALGG